MAKSASKSRFTLIALIVVGSAAAGLVVGTLTRPKPPSAEGRDSTRTASAPALTYLPSAIGATVAELERPQVTHLEVIDLDADGLKDVVYCEANTHTVRWIRQTARNVFEEIIVARDVLAPAHVSAADVNGTGRLDLLVASMGELMPNNARIGKIVILENVDNKTFKPHVLVADTARVTDIRAANMSGRTDGKLDLVVGQFGYDQGETRWMKNLGDWKFESQVINSQSGCIHTPIADFDGDGRPDFAALISQEWEEVHLFLNEGGGRFKESILWGSTNEDFGSSGLSTVDLNRDGRPDLIYTNGDGFDYAIRGPRPWHGIQWLENQGDGKFAYRRVGDLPGAYSPVAADLNGDGHLDLVAVSGFADWTDDNAVAMMAWLNDGKQNFTPVVLAHKPTQLMTLAVDDLDGDGVPELITGGCRAFPLPDHLSNVTLWRKQP